MFCNKCGTQLPEGSLFCSKCGNKLGENKLPNQTSFVAAKCTNCGGALSVDPSKEAAICPFCNQPYIVSKAINNITLNGHTSIDVANIRIDGAPSLENLIIRAQNYEKSGDIGNALNYYNKVLDISANNAVANEAINRINKFPFLSSPCGYMFYNGKLFLMKNKLAFVRKNGKQIDIPLNIINYAAVNTFNKKSILVEIPQNNFGNQTVKLYTFNLDSKPLAKQWADCITKAKRGIYPSQI